MNFEGVKAITVPEGNVRKIQRGEEVLWERKPDLVCSPYIAIHCTYAASDAYGTQWRFNCLVKGIDRELVMKFELVMHYQTSSGRPIEGVERYTELVLSDTADTVGGVEKSATAYTSFNTHKSPSFRVLLTYTDLNGNIKKLGTGYSVNAAGGFASGSA